MENELQNHKASDKIKWIFTGITFVLLFVLFAGLCMQLFGADKLKPSNWFKKTECIHIDEDKDGICDDCNNEMSEVTALSLTSFRSTVKATAVSIDEDYGIETYASPTVLYSEQQNLSNGTKLLGSNSKRYDYDRFSYSVGIKIPIDTTRCIKSFTLTFSNRELAVPFSFSYSSENSFDAVNYSASFSATSPINGSSGQYDTFPQAVAKLGMWQCGLRIDQSSFEFYAYTHGSGNYSWWSYKNNTSEYAFIKNIFLDTETTLSSVEFRDNSNNSANWYDYTVTESVSVSTTNPVVPLPDDPVKEGHTFIGWYMDSDFKTPYTGQTLHADTKLYAKFEINKYTVTFNSDGGSAVSSQTVNWNTSANLTTPTRDGYGFSGWFLPDGTQYSNQAIKTDTTLTARWYRNRFTVTFNSDGGNTVASQTVSLNGTPNLPTPIREGYTFKGWFMSNGTQYSNQAITDDLTLTAHWEIIICTVTFYVDGEVYDTLKVEYGTILIPVANELNLAVLSVYSENPHFNVEDFVANGVTTELTVSAAKIEGTNKVINTVKNNKWAVIGGVAGGIALISVIVAVCGGIKHKKQY